jgi:hypothetical protein
VLQDKEGSRGGRVNVNEGALIEDWAHSLETQVKACEILLAEELKKLKVGLLFWACRYSTHFLPLSLSYAHIFIDKASTHKLSSSSLLSSHFFHFFFFFFFN